MARLRFAWWALAARFRRECRRCPYCRSTAHEFLQRKKLLIEARRCAECGLIYRWPVDTASKAVKFYEKSYDSGIVTDLPGASELAALKRNGFKESRFDKPEYLKLVRETAMVGARILDYGCSWGYFGFQLKTAGFEVEGFELSQRRANYGMNQLGISITFSWDHLRARGLPRFDVLFCAHALEHVRDLKGVIEQFAEALVVNGKLIIVVPNGGGRLARELGIRWGPFIGETHTMALTAEWFARNLPRHRFRVIEQFSPQPGGRDLHCEGEELIIIASRE